MSDKTRVGVKVVKCIFILILVLGLIGSTVLFVFGLYALSDNENNLILYKNLMRYYGIDELDFENVFNDSQLLTTYTDIKDEYQPKQSLFGAIMVFVSVVSVIFEMIALIGAIKENIVITIVVLIFMIIGSISGIFTIKSIDICTLVTQLFFIGVAALYVILLRKDQKSRRMNCYSTDVEMNNSTSGAKRDKPVDHKYIDMKGGPPPYKEMDQNKNHV